MLIEQIRSTFCFARFLGCLDAERSIGVAQPFQTASTDHT